MTQSKVALITGCSDPTSLGASLASNLLGRGWTVFATAIEVESMSGLRKAGCHLLPLDVTVVADIQNAVMAIGSRLDLLINNAAVEGLGPILDTDPSRLLGMYQINVFGPLQLIQAFSNALIGSKGCVVNIGSVGVYGLPFHGAYASSKAALQIISDVLRREAGPVGLKVLTVELAMVMTAMLRGEDPYPLNLPESSRSPYFSRWYSTIALRYRDDIIKRSTSAMSATEAAKQIINAVDGGTERKIWVGTMAWIFRWLWPYLSTARQDKINSDLLHVTMLKSPAKE